jgi:hypothetical protein
MTATHRLLQQIHHEALTYALRALSRHDPGRADARNQQRYERLRTLVLERLSLLLNEADRACHEGIPYIWACAGEPPASPRAVSLGQLLLERIEDEIDQQVIDLWEGKDALGEGLSRHDQLSRDPKLRKDLEFAEHDLGRIKLQLDQEAAEQDDEQAAHALLVYLSNYPDADILALADLMSTDVSLGCWTPVRVLQVVAHLRATGEALSPVEQSLIATPAIVRRSIGISETRKVGILAGLRSLSERQWTLLDCCTHGSNTADEVARRFGQATGVAVSEKEVLRQATRIRTTALIPLASMASGDQAEEAETLVREVGAVLPDAERWEADGEYRATSLHWAMSLAQRERPGPHGAERPGAIALVAAARAELEPEEASCAFAVAVDPSFRPPAIDRTRKDPTATYRRRLSDILARQPALSAFFPRTGGGRRRRRDSLEPALTSVSIDEAN